MKHTLIIGLLWISMLTSCRKAYPGLQEAHISFPFNNGHIEMEVASTTIPDRIRDIHFFNETTGIAMSYDGKVYKTIDKGKTWDLKFTNAIPEQTFHEIVFKDQQTGYIAGGNSGCSGTGCTPPGAILIKTSDGGDTWQIIYQVPGMVEFRSATTNSQGELLLLQMGVDPCVLKSTDDGISFTKKAAVKIAANKITFAGQTAYITGGAGKASIVRSTDDGNTWTDTKTFPGNWTGDIAFAGNSAYCIVDGIRLYKSVDQGASWQMCYENTMHASSRINALSDKCCLLWGSGEYTGGCFGFSYGAFRHSADGGAHWTETQLKEIGNISVSDFYSASEGYILAGKLIQVKVIGE